MEIRRDLHDAESHGSDYYPGGYRIGNIHAIDFQ